MRRGNTVLNKRVAIVPSAHIRILFSDLVHPGDWCFLQPRPIRSLPAFEIAVTTAPRRSREAGQRSNTFCRERSPPPGLRLRAADPPFKGIALILPRRYFLGASDCHGEISIGATLP
jgi:hypothetical protein